MIQKALAAVTLLVVIFLALPAQGAQQGTVIPPPETCFGTYRHYALSDGSHLHILECGGSDCCQEVTTDHGDGSTTTVCGGCSNLANSCSEQCKIGKYTVTGVGSLPVAVGECLPPCPPGCAMASDEITTSIFDENGYPISAVLTIYRAFCGA